MINAPVPSFHQIDSLLRVFTGGFSAAQIAEPLRSFEDALVLADSSLLDEVIQALDREP